MSPTFFSVKTFLYELLAEAALPSGVYPELEGVPQSPSDRPLRLRAGFRTMENHPETDGLGSVTGILDAVILSEPGDPRPADLLSDDLLQTFSPGCGERKNACCRIITSSVTAEELKTEGRYRRIRVPVSFTAWNA